MLYKLKNMITFIYTYIVTHIQWYYVFIHIIYLYSPIYTFMILPLISHCISCGFWWLNYAYTTMLFFVLPVLMVHMGMKSFFFHAQNWRFLEIGVPPPLSYMFGIFHELCHPASGVTPMASETPRSPPLAPLF